MVYFEKQNAISPYKIVQQRTRKTQQSGCRPFGSVYLRKGMGNYNILTKIKAEVDCF